VFPIPQSLLLRKSASAVFVAFLLLALRTPGADVDSLEDATRLLADRVASIPDLRGPLRVEFNTSDGLASSPGKAWQDLFRKRLEVHNLTLTEDPVAPLLRVAVTATPSQWILAATARPADHDELRLVSLPRAALRSAALPAAPLRIERQLVFESPERILDASSLSHGSEGSLVLLAYRNGELTAFQLDPAGALKQSVPLAAAETRRCRDPHGELNTRNDDADVLLPDKICTFAWASGAAVKCRSAKPEWRGTAVLAPPCDSAGWKVFAGGRDWTTPEVLQLVPNGAAREGSTAMVSELPGPVLNVNREQHPASALVVTRNLRSGNYEVYRITIACGN